MWGTPAQPLITFWVCLFPAQELCINAGIPVGLPVGEVDKEQWDALWTAWTSWLSVLKEGDSFVPCSCPDTGAYSVLGAFPVPAPEGSLHALLRAYYATIQGEPRYCPPRDTDAEANGTCCFSVRPGFRARK